MFQCNAYEFLQLPKFMFQLNSYSSQYFCINFQILIFNQMPINSYSYHNFFINFQILIFNQMPMDSNNCQNFCIHFMQNIFNKVLKFNFIDLPLYFEVTPVVALEFFKFVKAITLRIIHFNTYEEVLIYVPELLSIFIFKGSSQFYNFSWQNWTCLSSRRQSYKIKFGLIIHICLTFLYSLAEHYFKSD